MDLIEVIDESNHKKFSVSHTKLMSIFLNAGWLRFYFRAYHSLSRFPLIDESEVVNQGFDILSTQPQFEGLIPSLPPPH